MSIAYCPLHGTRMSNDAPDLAGNEVFYCPSGEIWYLNGEHGTFSPEVPPGEPPRGMTPLDFLRERNRLNKPRRARIGGTR